MHLLRNLTFLIFVILFSGKSNEILAQSSLEEGEIYKIAVDKSGIYSLNANFFQESIGKSLSEIDPDKIQLFCNGGGMVPSLNSIPRFNDPEEIAIFVSGASDGNFDSEDAVFFYAPGPENMNWELDDEIWSIDQPLKEANIYDSRNYLYLKINENSGKRIQDKNSVGSPEQTYSTSHKIHKHEVELENLLGSYGSTQGSGKRWFGEAFANEWDQDFSSSFSEVSPISGSSILLNAIFAGRSDNLTTVTFNIEGEGYNRSIFGTDIGDVEDPYAHIARFEEQLEVGNSPSISVTYNPSESTDEGWLDYIQIISEEEIKNNNNELLMHLDSKNHQVAGFTASQFAGKQIWDITNFENPFVCLPANDVYAFNTEGIVKQFRLFDINGEFEIPDFIEQVENQNLKDLRDIDFAIVYHKDFEEAANLLADHRSSHDPLRVKTVEISKIYNEFSSGRQDPTALRDFARYLYLNNKSFKYLLLFGDATYDYRGLVSDIPKNNFVPTFETDESLDPIDAFPYDDYFALLDDSEGIGVRGTLDIAVGRIPVKTNQEGLDVVNKIIHYDVGTEEFGDWKLNICFSADDEDTNTHIDDADDIAVMVKDSFPLFNQRKVYFDAFVQESTPGGERYPAAKSKIAELIDKGLLVYNYLGHGGPRGLAQERVLLAEDIRNWTNYDRLPLIVTATCSFTGYDDPAIITAGEEAILNPDGGAVALFTTTRAVFASQNARLTESVFETLFEKEFGDYLRLGDIIQKAKNTDTIRQNSRKFSLIGDPTLRLGAPQHNVVLDEINGLPITETIVDTLSALETVRLKGHIENDGGQILSDFNGTVSLTLFDKVTEAKTLANNEKSNVRSFDVQNNILFKGKATLQAGQFEVEFLIPKEINFNYGPGKLSMYATDGLGLEAGGLNGNIIIGGSSNVDITDEVGPSMEIYMNDESFVSGGITNLTPRLIVNLEDDFGINISSTSIGHDITAVIDGDESREIKLNDWYESEIDNFKKGKVNYPLSGIEPGVHTIRIKAWDICNNSTEKELEFRVVDKDQDQLEQILNYPNPFTTSTNFSFEHSLVDASLDILVSIYTLSGKLVKSIQTNRFAEGFRIDDIHWDGRDDFGSRLARGVYLYKIKVKDQAADIDLESDFQKLLILK